MVAPEYHLTAILSMWIPNNTQRSVLPVIAFHFVGNLTGETIGFSPELYPFVHVGMVLAVIVVVVGWSPSSLRGWGRPRPVPASDSS
ncbi:hypothetical protein [Natrinema gelatinilyticum]|uniref:hypothetical protein n=1 Tax=Natrinema gelatinilyticum TaxID=2961571 RepID=UPI0020C2D1D9|nr:hypothetical protein [Natrinema gelatinilyticum]